MGELGIRRAGGLRAAVAEAARLPGTIGHAGGEIALRELAREHARVLDVGIAKRDIASARLACGFLGGILARIEVGGGLARNRHGALGDAAGKERDRGDEVACKHADVRVDVAHPGKGREAETRAATRGRHALVVQTPIIVPAAKCFIK